MAIIIGMEPANSNVKVVSNVLKKVDMYLNTTTKVAKFGNGTGIATPNTYQVKEVNGEVESYMVGQLQKDRNKNRSSSGDADRYEKKEFRIESEIAIFRELERIEKQTPTLAFGDEEIFV